MSVAIATVLDMTEKAMLLGTISDMYKEVHGVRPSLTPYVNLPESELHEEIDRLGREAQHELERERWIESQCVDAFKTKIDSYLNSGAADETTALSWMMQNHQFHGPQCVDHWLWEEGILFTDYGRQLLDKLYTIVEYDNVDNITEEKYVEYDHLN